MKKIKYWKGLFYRKLAEKNKEEEFLPKFFVKKPTVLVEFPKVIDIKKVNIIYSLIEPFAYANIKWNPKIKELVYNLIEPKLTRKEAKILEKISEGLIELVEVELSAIREPSKIIKYLEENVKRIIREFGLRINRDQYVKMMYYIYRNFIGYNEIEPLLQDPNIEDISCDGIAIPIYVLHRKFGSLKTNISYKDLESLREFVVKLAERCGRYVSFAEPILAGTLPDGSRVSATIAGDVATRGPVFTIRKFGERPFSPVDQIEFGTASVEVLAYLWYLVEHGASMLITGGTATGKTSLLNSICMFVPPEAKIVCATKDSNVLLNDHIQSIGSLVEREMKNYTKDNVLTPNPKNPIKFYGWDTKTFDLKKQNIKALIKIKAPSKLVRILTEYGAYVTLTPNTKVPVVRGDELLFMKAGEIDESCFIPQISKIDVPTHLPSFDPIDFAQKCDLRVKVKRELLRKCAKKVGGVNKLLKILKWKPKKLYRKSFSVDELIYLVKKLGLNKELIKDYLISIGRYKTMSIFFDIPPELFYVAGLLVTDGHLPKNRKLLMFQQVKDRKIQKRRMNILSKYFGSPATKEDCFSSEPAWYFFNKIFEIPLGEKSRKTKVPSIVMNAPEKHAYEYLRGVIDGDSSIRRHVITIYTVSEKFAEGLVYLLLRFGIVAKHSQADTLAKDLHFITIESRYFDILADRLSLERRNPKYLQKSSDVMLPKEIGLIIKRIMKENNISINIFNDLRKQGIPGHVFYDKNRKLIRRDTILLMLNRLKKKLPNNEKLEQLTKLLDSADTIWTKVKKKKIVPANEEFVYDLTPEKTEYFPSGRFGFIVIQDSIEDTREIRIPHVHWVPGLARVGFGIPLASGEKYGGVTLFDLLKESFRQNPDYVVVGETRGPEAYVMFQGMASGHTCLSTFHAGSLDTLVKRLITPPIELSPTLIESLDVVILMIYAREKGKSARRIKEIVEIESVDPKTGEVKTKVIFLWNPSTDTFEKIEDSVKVKKIVAATGGRIEDALTEIRKREKLLKWLKKNKIRNYLEVTKYINMYYKEPEKLLKMIEEGLVAAKVETKKKPRRLSSIFEMLGFKVIKEK